MVQLTILCSLSFHWLYCRKEALLKAQTGTLRAIQEGEPATGWGAEFSSWFTGGVKPKKADKDPFEMQHKEACESADVAQKDGDEKPAAKAEEVVQKDEDEPPAAKEEAVVQKDSIPVKMRASQKTPKNRKRKATDAPSTGSRRSGRLSARKAASSAPAKVLKFSD